MISTGLPIYCIVELMMPSDPGCQMPADDTERQVLVVDDDGPLLDALYRSLSADYSVTACSTFEEGRRRLREQRFHVLITDVRLGAFNGLQLAVIARDLNHGMQIIVISGYDDPVLRAEAEHVGAIYLVKPVSSARLIQLIRSKAP